MNTSPEALFILLFVIATAVAIAVRWLRLPYTIALVLTGLLLGTVSLVAAPRLTKTLLFSAFLPGLVFEAAFHIDSSELWRNRAIIGFLAVPGILASIALTTLVLTPIFHTFDFVEGLNWRHALVFGALIAATDPIAVLGIFRSLGVPRRLQTLLEGESLFNDGTGIVFFALSLGLLAGRPSEPGQLALELLRVVGLGAAIGGVTGLGVSLLFRRIDDPMIEITLTTIAAYGSFMVAEQVGVSGVIATVVAGLVCAQGARGAMSASTRVAAETFWDYVAFALNSIVFLLIGFEVQVSALVSSWQEIVIAYVVVTVVRAQVISAGWLLVRPTSERFPWRWALVLTWGGFRGALPMVLVLSVPHHASYRAPLVSMTFGVVLISILMQGLTMPGLLRRLSLVRDRSEFEDLELRRWQIRMVDAALEEIDRIDEQLVVQPDVAEVLRDVYRERGASAREELRSLDLDRHGLREDELYSARHRLLLTEKRTVMEGFNDGAIGQTTRDRLLADVDARLLELESREIPAEPTSRPREDEVPER